MHRWIDEPMLTRGVTLPVIWTLDDDFSTHYRATFREGAVYPWRKKEKNRRSNSSYTTMIFLSNRRKFAYRFLSIWIPRVTTNWTNAGNGWRILKSIDVVWRILKEEEEKELLWIKERNLLLRIITLSIPNDFCSHSFLITSRTTTKYSRDVRGDWLNCISSVMKFEMFEIRKREINRR